jgi:hypothetical protein
MAAHQKSGTFAFITAVFALAACGAQSDASADSGDRAAGKVMTASVPATSQPASTTTTAPVALPPAALTAWEGYARQECRAMGERFTPVGFTPLGNGGMVDRPGRGGFVTTDFNGDGQPDFVAVTASQGCAGQGPGQGAVDFIVSTGSGYRAVDGYAGPFDAGMIKKRNGHDVVEYPGGFFGSCGEVTVAVWGWSGQRMEVVERRNSKGQGVDKEGCAVAARASATPAGNSTFPPIEPGYWAGGVSCAEAIEEVAEVPPDQRSLHYLDARGGWIGRFEIQRYAALGQNRYRFVGRDHTEIGSSPGQMNITVNSRTSFTATYSDGYSGSFTHCPTSTIPRAIRADFGNR